MFNRSRYHCQRLAARATFSFLLSFSLMRPTMVVASALGDLAASMQPGTWATLATNNTGVLRVGSSTGTIAPYSMSGVWNPSTRKVHYVGMDHGYPNLRHVIYDEATNSWQLLSEPSVLGPAHGYEHLAINSFTGDIYHRKYSAFSGKIDVYRCSNPCNNGSYSLWTTLSTPFDQVAIGTGFWSGNITGATTGVGAYVIYNSGTPNGDVFLVNPATGSLIAALNGFGGTSTYHSFFEYSAAKNVAVFGGGNDNPNKIWKLNSNRTITSLNAPPVSLGIQRGFVAADPVTGNFLILHSGNLYELNPDGSGTYTLLSGSRVPPSGVGNPASPSLASMFVVPIDTYGVIMYVTCSSGSCSVNLYKHTGGTGTPVPPAPTLILTANPSSVTSGSSATLTWSATDATSCTASGGWSGTKTLSGSQSTGALSANTIYTLTCTGAGGSANQSATVTVSSGTASAPTLTLSANPTSVSAGNASTLTWSSANATSCTASGGWSGTKAVSGSQSTGALTANTTYTLTCTGSGGSTNQTATVTIAGSSSTPSTGSLDFQTRCSGSGVIRCFGFDSNADLGVTGSNAFGANYGNFTNGGACNSSSTVLCPTIDATTSASGTGSLKFTVPSLSGAGASGQWFTNFSSDLSTQFGETSEFFVQWRQRFSPEFLSTVYQGGGGWKQAIIGTGDNPGTPYGSCTALETVTQNTSHRGFAQMYNSCTGSSSHGAYAGFEEPFGSYDFKLQNARPSPYCLYSQSGSNRFPPAGNCFGYFANEWMTFQVQIKTGPRINDEFTNSFVRLWIAREGQPSELVFDWGPYNLSAGSISEDQRFGKIWLLPYNTDKSSSQTHPTAYTWYDELIISRTKIADPASGGSTGSVAQVPAAPSGLTVK